jgi:iron complex outermembrane receptor protein
MTHKVSIKADLVGNSKNLSKRALRRAVRIATAAAALAACALPLQAQTAATADTQATSQLEEILVTAQKRIENIQTVPFSVSAVTGEALAKFQYKDLKDLNGTVPNVEFTQITNVSLNLAPSIRGIGSTNNPDPYTGTEVAVVIDGVVEGTRLLGLSDQFDIDRIEVLRGPQGTLFGADTLGGVVNVVTRAPTGELGVYGDLTVGNYHEVNGAAALNFPIVSNILAGKVSVSHRGQDGFYTNTADGTNLMWVDSTKTRAYLQFTPNDDVKAVLTVGNDHTRNGADTANNVSTPGEVFYRPGVTTGAISFNVYSNAPAPNNADLDLYTLNVDWKSPIGKLTSITNYTKFHAFNVQDVDELPGEFLLNAGRYPSSWQYSQELRSEFSPLESIDVIFGAFFMKLHTDINTVTAIPFAGAGLLTTQHVFEDQKSQAIFSQVYWNMTSTLRLGAGLRGTRIDTGLTSVNTTLDNPNLSPVFFGPNVANATNLGGFTANGHQSWTDPGGKISLDYKILPDVMLYGYYARGFKSGGFNGRVTIPQDIGPFNPEFINSFEVGVRSDWLDKRLRANVAVFLNKWKNMQVPNSIFTGNPPEASSTILNAASATTKGAEFELEAIPVEGLNLRATLGYLDARYDKFSDVGVDFSGRQTPYSPKWTGSTTASYVIKTPAGPVTPSLQYTYTAHQWSNFTQAPAEFIRSVGLVKVNVNYVPPGQKWSLSLWSTNLFDKKYVISSLDVPPLFSFATYGAPRQFGADVHFDF